VASVSLCGAAPLQTQTYLVAKQGNCGKQILRPRLFTPGDFVPYLYLALTCYLLCSCMICLLLASVCVFAQGGVSGQAGGYSDLHIPLCIIILYTCCALVLYSAVHHIGLNTLHKRIIFIVLSYLKLNKSKICSHTYSPPLGIPLRPGTFNWYQSQVALLPRLHRL